MRNEAVLERVGEERMVLKRSERGKGIGWNGGKEDEGNTRKEDKEDKRKTRKTGRKQGEQGEDKEDRRKTKRTDGRQRGQTEDKEDRRKTKRTEGKTRQTIGRQDDREESKEKRGSEGECVDICPQSISPSLSTISQFTCVQASGSSGAAMAVSKPSTSNTENSGFLVEWKGTSFLGVATLPGLPTRLTLPSATTFCYLKTKVYVNSPQTTDDLKIAVPRKSPTLMAKCWKERHATSGKDLKST
ncbi:hypothetical protein ANN_11203 [Periplaneta americana]|uniref:Uncharacterized protein n=1 Tax=Periplaneta americana TaxID=6978 RepID=A0ABQ8T5X0_PERAM|nr:hypothetical protein ANN_11203 [Periplaneta americana]